MMLFMLESRLLGINNLNVSVENCPEYLETEVLLRI